MKPLHGKVALIHDAAHPVAQSIAHGLQAAGASVILASRRHLKADCGHCLSFPVRTSDEMLLARKAILRAYGALDAVIVLPEDLHVHSELSSCCNEVCDRTFNQTIKLQFALARCFIPLLSVRESSLYITVSSSSIANHGTDFSMEHIAQTVQFMLAQSLCVANGKPGLHNLVLSSDSSEGDTWITPANVAEALVTLMRNASWNRGCTEFQSNWRDRMETPEPGLYVGGI